MNSTAFQNERIREHQTSYGSAQIYHLGQPHRSVVFEPESKWLEPSKFKLNELVSRLKDNWDGYGGMPVKFLNAHFAVQVLNSICKSATPAPAIVPGRMGDLQLEWHTKVCDIELHILAPNQVRAYYLKAPAGEEPEEIELNLGNDFTVVAGWVGAMTEAEVAPTATSAQ